MRNLLTSDTPRRVFGQTNFSRRGRQALAISIAVTLLNVLTMTGYATPKQTPNSTIGTIRTEGVVRLNGSPVISGQTLFTDCDIVTSIDSESALVLANRARLTLGQESALTLASSSLGISASLDTGTVRALVPRAVRANIKTADALITTDAAETAAFNVMIDDCSTILVVQTGRVEIRAGDYVRSVSSGESFSTAAGPPPPPPAPHLSRRKKVGLFLGIAGGIAILLIALTGREKPVEMPSGGCVTVGSGPTVGGC